MWKLNQQQKKIRRELRRNKLRTGIFWAVGSDSRAYVFGIHSWGIKMDSVNISQWQVEEQEFKRAWNLLTSVKKAMISKSE